MLDLAFDTLGLHRVRAELDPRNDASIALCRRLGMREEAHVRAGPVVQGRLGRHRRVRDPRRGVGGATRRIGSQHEPAELDAADPLAPYRDRFVPAPDVVAYLDGNSLGRPLTASVDRVECGDARAVGAGA